MGEKIYMAGRPQKNRDDKTFIARRLEKLLAGENFAEFERVNRLPESTVRRIMNGNDPRISTLSMIAKACNVTLDYFFEAEEASKKAPATSAGADDKPGYRDVVIQFLQVQEEISALTRGIVEAGFSSTMLDQSDLQARILRLQGAISRLKSAAGLPDQDQHQVS